MTAPNASSATPGQRFTDPDDGTWVRRPGAVLPWAEYDADGVFNPRTQEEAEAAGLELLHELSEDDVRLLAACRAVSTGIPDPGARIVETESRSVRIAWAGEDAAPAPLDPGNPEHLRQVADFIEAMAVARDWEEPDRMKLCPLWIREEAERLDRQHDKAEQEAAEAAKLAAVLADFSIYDTDGSRDDAILAGHLVRRGVRVIPAEETKP